MLLQSRVDDFRDGHLMLSNGETVDVDLVILATTAAPPCGLDNFNLPLADDGFLAVTSTLNTTADHPVFVVGDTATLTDNPVPKAGVYAVREGPILWENLQRAFNGDSLVAYRPQRGFLSLLNTGDGRAIGQYGQFAAHNRLMWSWKDYLDRKFMRMYQDYSPMTMMSAVQHSETPSGMPEMKCRGCGGKVGANVLSAALDRLEINSGTATRIGL